MASVQYLFSNVQTFSKELVTVQKHFTLVTKFRMSFVITIQKTWRGYKAYKDYQHIRNAIITIQSFFRGWKVRKNRKLYQEQHAQDVFHLQRKLAATKLQSWWRGMTARKYMKDRLPRERIAERKRILEVNQKMAAEMRQIIEENTMKRKEEDERKQQQEALVILYKCHHLLRTLSSEGIYSCHGRQELSLIEMLMKSLPCRDYMDNLHRLYFELQTMEKRKKRTYTYKKISQRNLEDAVLAANIYEEKKSKLYINGSKEDEEYDKRFSLDCKVDEKPYIKSIHNDDGKYRNLLKTSRDPLEQNFNLTLRTDLKNREIPYFIDYWEKEIFGKDNSNSKCS